MKRTVFFAAVLTAFPGVVYAGGRLVRARRFLCKPYVLVHKCLHNKLTASKSKCGVKPNINGRTFRLCCRKAYMNKKR